MQATGRSERVFKEMTSLPLVSAGAEPHRPIRGGGGGGEEGETLLLYLRRHVLSPSISDA